MLQPDQMDEYLGECRALALAELGRVVPAGGRYGPMLYDLMLDYPRRASKGLRPALCIAACRALGGAIEPVLQSAAVLELYHNAFLIHDDVEDGSELRRDGPTLHRTHGVPVAVNVGDAMLALALEPLLDNMASVGLGKAIRILRLVARMARESAEGQALELDWMRRQRWDLADADYVRMVYKKTSWYTFVAPVLIGAVVAGAAPDRLHVLRRFAALLGIAFQIQDDVLNLVGEEAAYGKEIAGDLWEGKRTLLVAETLRAAGPAERARIQAILVKRRPAPGEEEPGAKTEAEIRWLAERVRRGPAVGHARAVAARYAGEARRQLARAAWLAPSVHRDFLEGLVDFVVERSR